VAQSQKPRRVVYTALMGGYQALAAQPAAVNSDIDWICFTDDPTLRSDYWNIRVVRPAIPWDPARSVRSLKSTGYRELLSDYDESLWIDNRIQLLESPSSLLAHYLANNDIAMLLHSNRACVRDEFEAVLIARLDRPYRVRELKHQLSLFAPDILAERPYWGAIIFRRHENEEVFKAMTLWRNMVFRYSRRDQLSLNYALQEYKLDVERINVDNRISSWHRWIPDEELPKDKKMVFDQGFRYRLVVRAWDWLRCSKGAHLFRRLFRRMGVRRHKTL